MSMVAWSKELKELAARAGSRVVAVTSGRGRASGWLWDATHVLTVEHALQRGCEVQVTTADGVVAAQVVGTRPGVDLALLRLERELPLGEFSWRAASEVDPGELVVALARSPEDGLGVSLGVVACRSGGWTTCRGGQLEQFLQPDLNLYPGYSGGPLVDVEGRILGLNTRGLSRHQPVTLTLDALEAAVEGILTARDEPAYLGAGLQSVRFPAAWEESLGHVGGAMVISLEKRSPAGDAGVMLGDILVELAGVDTPGTPQVLETLYSLKAGQQASSRWVRAGALQDIELQLGRRPSTGEEES